MTDATLRIQADFDRLAALDDGGWDHNRHYHPYLLRFLPARRERALEVGCGTGAFARSLARHFERVTAIDLSPEMVRRARELSGAAANVEYRQADFLTGDVSPETFDCIATLATLHHLPFDEALGKMRAALRPGGVLLVLDLYRPKSVADWGWSACAYPWNLLLRAWRLRRLRDAPHVRQAWSEHARHDVYPTLAEVRAVAGRVLHGAAVRRHLFWRYSLVWTKPGVPA
ncbi:MAG TPA: class I SAM-dependent methyltransferase [Longimicrobium sp.]|nr:class I SAM-dependent methyltransferase [Longimicrobium sp.]